ncbi:MAG: Ig-like domain-containing protein [Muribaculaceae bacterium]|nr:Ig-like domain-containing protein [Muribaculaceae bacterium]
MSSGRIRYLFPLFYFFCFLSLAQAAPAPLKDAKLVSDNQSVNSGQSFEAVVGIDFGSSPAVAYSGFQFDVILPQDISFEDVTLAPALAGIFTLSSKMDANGSVRVIAYSSGASSSTLENGIVTLKLKVDRAPLGNTAVITLNDVDLSSPEGVDLPLMDSDFTIDINIVAYSLELDPSELTLLTGQSEDITATILPANVTDNTVTWSSQDGSVAIYEDGKILGLSAGTTTITAFCGDVSASCSVTVKSGSEITVTPGDGTGNGPDDDDGNGWITGNDVYVHVNRTVTMDLQLPDELSEIPSLTWSLANGGESFVRLTPSGDTLSAAFTGLSMGVTSYTVSLNGEELLTGKVTVIAEITMKSLELDPASLSMAQNALPQTIKPVYTPSEATMPEFNWESSNPAVASVDNEGNVTPHSQGQTTITATALDGSSLSATCEVTVTAPIAESFEFDFDESVMGGKEGISLYIGDTYQFTPKAQAGYVLPEVINWTSSDPTTVSVTNDGTITALALGQATITATATVNGKQVTATCKVTVIPQEPDEPEYIADTPTELLRKGDGTSHTFVAMMEKTDEVLESAGYHYVFGYTNLREGSVTLEDTLWRYTYTTEEVYWNPSNDFWVFAYFIDADGMLHISSRRHLDGTVDEDFNPMDFIGKNTRSDDIILGIYNMEGKYLGTNLDLLESGIYIIRSTNSSYKVIK